MSFPSRLHWNAKLCGARYRNDSIRSAPQDPREHDSFEPGAEPPVIVTAEIAGERWRSATRGSILVLPAREARRRFDHRSAGRSGRGHAGDRREARGSARLLRGELELRGRELLAVHTGFDLGTYGGKRRRGTTADGLLEPRPAEPARTDRLQRDRG